MAALEASSASRNQDRGPRGIRLRDRLEASAADELPALGERVRVAVDGPQSGKPGSWQPEELVPHPLKGFADDLQTGLG